MIYIKNTKLRNYTIKILNIAIKFVKYLNIKNIRISSYFLNKIKFLSTCLYDDYVFLNYVNKKKEGLKNNFDTIKTLVIRGSNSDYGFYSPNWKNSYNLGLTSTDLYTTYKIYENYKNELKVLENIILFFNIPSPGYSLIHTTERYRCVAYKYFFEVPYLDYKQINPNLEKIIVNNIKKIKKSIFIDSNYSGYDFKTYYGTQIATKTRAKKHLRENNREPNQLHWLKLLSQLAAEDKRKLYIVNPPVRSDFKKELPNQSILFHKLFALENLKFLNFYDSTIFSDYDFGDTDHLNEQGAIKLTNEIYKLIN